MSSAFDVPLNNRCSRVADSDALTNRCSRVADFAVSNAAADAYKSDPASSDDSGWGTMLSPGRERLASWKQRSQRKRRRLIINGAVQPSEQSAAKAENVEKCSGAGLEAAAAGPAAVEQLQPANQPLQLETPAIIGPIASSVTLPCCSTLDYAKTDALLELPLPLPLCCSRFWAMTARLEAAQISTDTLCDRPSLLSIPVPDFTLFGPDPDEVPCPCANITRRPNTPQDQDEDDLPISALARRDLPIGASKESVEDAEFMRALDQALLAWSQQLGHRSQFFNLLGTETEPDVHDGWGIYIKVASFLDYVELQPVTSSARSMRGFHRKIWCPCAECFHETLLPSCARTTHQGIHPGYFCRTTGCRPVREIGVLGKVRWSACGWCNTCAVLSPFPDPPRSSKGDEDDDDDMDAMGSDTSDDASQHEAEPDDAEAAETSTSALFGNSDDEDGEETQETCSLTGRQIIMHDPKFPDDVDVEIEGAGDPSDPTPTSVDSDRDDWNYESEDDDDSRSDAPPLPPPFDPPPQRVYNDFNFGYTRNVFFCFGPVTFNNF